MTHVDPKHLIPASPASLWGDPIPPSWFIVQCEPGREAKGRAFGIDMGAEDCWFPTAKEWIPNPKPGGKRKVKRWRTLAPGYLFLCVDREPKWRQWFDHPVSTLKRVMTYSTRIEGRMVAVPYALSNDDLARMRDVPKALEALQEARRKAEAIEPGVRARLVDHPLGDYAMDVESVRGDVVEFFIRELNMRGKTTREKVRRA